MRCASAGSPPSVPSRQEGRESLVGTMDSVVYVTPATSSRPELSAGNVFAPQPCIATRPAALALPAGRHGLNCDGKHQPVVAHSLSTTGSPGWFRLGPVADVHRDRMRWRLSVAATPVEPASSGAARSLSALRNSGLVCCGFSNDGACRGATASLSSPCGSAVQLRWSDAAGVLRQ